MDTPEEKRVYLLTDARPIAIVVYCNDPRFQKPIREFIGHDLGLQEGDYVPLVVPGSIASLTEPLRLPKEFKFMKERLEFMLDRFNTVKRIVLINHEDCRHYQMLGNSLGAIFLQHVQHMTERQLRDLKLVSGTILALAAPGLQLEMYYARIVKNGAVTVKFERV